jgi:hypothetical protein
MKKASILLALTILLIGGVIVSVSTPALAQPMPHQRGPWTGNNTPWTYYHGDWFHNGILRYFYGQKNGWAPYYSKAPGQVERPGEWYGEKWEHWYRDHPNYWQNFEREYPYWREHRIGQRYDEDFYKHHHHGRGGGWQQPYRGEEEEHEHGQH